MSNRYPRPTQNVDHSLAARRIEREDREAYRAACRQIDEAVSDIIRIAERAKAAIEDESWRYPCDGEQPFV